MNENLKNKNTREAIKKRVLVELRNPLLPEHRKAEVESILYFIRVFEREYQGWR